jgi:hypothetical protein
MADRFIERQAFMNYVNRNHQATVRELIAGIDSAFHPLVCAVGLEDILDVIEIHEGEDLDYLESISPNWREEVLDLYAARIDWTACHQELSTAVADIIGRARSQEHNDIGTEKY